MYLHLGEETTVRTADIVGVFDIENTSVSRYTKDFLAASQKRGEVVNVSYEMPKSFTVCESDRENKVYISQISAKTLMKRSRAC